MMAVIICSFIQNHKYKQLKLSGCLMALVSFFFFSFFLKQSFIAGKEINLESLPSVCLCQRTVELLVSAVISTLPVSMSVHSQFKLRITSFSIKGSVFSSHVHSISFLLMKSSINCKPTHKQHDDDRNTATDRILTAEKLALNANKSLNRLEQSSLLNSTPEYVLVPREVTLILKCFCQYWFQTTGRHFNSIYRSRRVMLMSFWPVKNILLFENILASALGANWALWQCSAWLVHINTKGWKILFCCSFRELSKKKDKKKIK